MREEATVRKLHGDSVPVAPLPAIGVSVVSNLPGDRQITAQTFVPQEEGEEAMTRVLDMMTKAVDRQKARYELEQFEADLAKMEKTLRQYREDFNRIAHDHAAKEVTLNEKVAALREEKTAIRNEAYDRFVNSGRRGKTAETFELQGHDLANSNRKDAAIESLIGQALKEANEHAQAKQQLEISVARYEEEIAKCKREIEKRKTLLGLE